MDGVLCDSEPFLYEAAWEMFSRRYGIQVKPEDFLPFVGTGEDRYLGGVAQKYGVELVMPSDKQFTYEIYLEVIRDRLQALRGAVQFVGKCRSWDLKLAVATSADRVKMEGNLKQIGLPPELFDVCVTGSEVDRKKPDPQIFQVAAQFLGLNGARCLVVEDAPVGIRAAKAAGALCLGLTSSFTAADLRAAGTDWVATDLASVPGDLLRLLKGKRKGSSEGLKQ